MLPKGQMGDGIPACLVEMTVDDHTKEFWIRAAAGPRAARSSASRSRRGSYEIAYDVDRKDRSASS